MPGFNVSDKLNALFDANQSKLAVCERAGTSGNLCMKTDAGYTCTCERGHIGYWHVAHGATGTIIHRWQKGTNK